MARSSSNICPTKASVPLIATLVPNLSNSSVSSPINFTCCFHWKAVCIQRCMHGLKGSIRYTLLAREGISVLTLCRESGLITLGASRLFQQRGSKNGVFLLILYQFLSFHLFVFQFASAVTVMSSAHILATICPSISRANHPTCLPQEASSFSLRDRSS